MSRSDSSDSEYERKRRKKSKKSHHRSRSRSSSSSDRSSRKRKSHKSSRGRSRSRSRERRRSHSRDRKYSRSRSRDHKDKYYKRRERSRSKSNEKDRYSSKYRSEPEEKKSGWDVTELKDEISNTQYVPSFEDVEKIERESFVQQSFSSTMSNSANMPKQNKKKKKGKNKQQQQNINTETPKIDLKKELSVSHENAIFGATSDAMLVGKFTNRIDDKRKHELKTIENDDLIFGAMFFEEPEKRMERWIEKLTIIRERLRNKNTA